MALVLMALVFLAVNADKKIVGAQGGGPANSQTAPGNEDGAGSEGEGSDGTGSQGGSALPASPDGAAPGTEGQGGDSEGQSDTQGGLTQEEQTRLLAELARRDPADSHGMGKVDAPVVIIEYADLTCPYCSVFALETMPKIVENYVDQGLVRIEWRDLPLFGDPSGAAAFGGRSAGAQGKFWEFQEALFRAQIPRDQVTKESVTEVAQSLNLDIEKFEAGFTEQAFYDAISRDYTEASHIGVQSTPTFLVNGVPLVGAQEYAVFEQVIEAELAKVR